MSDIFLSYAREDLQRARQLTQALERNGWEVFWDRTIPAGQKWRQYVGKRLEEAKCVLVVWSAASIESDWVLEEADEGRERDVLVPVVIDSSIRPPRGFRAVQAEDLTSWDGSDDFPEFVRLIKAIESKIGAASQRVTPSISQRPEMVLVPAGRFKMGENEGVGDDRGRPIHEVRILEQFAIGRYQITFVEYDHFADATHRELPSDNNWGRGRRPVVNVSWHDAAEYARWLSVHTGCRYRLPTEAEWEFAARSAGTIETWAGTSDERVLGDYAWYAANSSSKTQPVGTKKPNGLDLYDMSGNVWEWVQDCWHENYNGAPADGSAWLEEGGGNCGQRVMRGGSWGLNAWHLRSSLRLRYDADGRLDSIGFRLVQDID